VLIVICAIKLSHQTLAHPVLMWHLRGICSCSWPISYIFPRCCSLSPNAGMFFQMYSSVSKSSQISPNYSLSKCPSVFPIYLPYASKYFSVSKFTKLFPNILHLLNFINHSKYSSVSKCSQMYVFPNIIHLPNVHRSFQIFFFVFHMFTSPSKFSLVS
jgi:hypothetical protein